MDPRTAASLLVAKVLTADGLMQGRERDLLEATMERLGLDDAQRQSVRDLEGIDQAEAAVASLDPDSKRALVDALMAGALVDGRLSPHEIATIQRITALLGL